MPSYSDSWYTEPMSRHGRKAMVDEDGLKDLDPGQEIYSISGKAPDGYYSAGMVDGGAGYEDHQVFKKLPEAKAPETNNEPVEETKSNKDKNKDKSKTQVSVAPSQEVTEAKQRSSAYREEMLNGNGFGAYGPKKSAFAERSSEIYNPNEDFQANQQSSVSVDGNDQAQSFAQSKLNDVKNKYNFQPTLK